ncbi:MAG: decaprenyl-phosphate phosphoribosyltransferase [Chloroflexi bacterium]|nr:decaprenyl-phosphate phosphoribosyltransferase [Chloroflexota bacterium]
MARGLLVAVRPKQWLKNGLLFVPLVFTLNIGTFRLLVQSVEAVLIFCALSSAGYLLNDVADVTADRQHPRKRFRPIAAGVVPVPLALGLGLVLASGGVVLAFLLRPQFGLLALLYLALTASYTLWLKHIVLLDIFGLAGGFVLRAVAGAVAINVPASPWLYIATLLGALLIALGKRRAELSALGAGAGEVRRNLEAYSLPLIDQLITVVSSAAVMTYALYTFSAENLPRDRSMMLTIPVVLYGMFRYLYLVHDGGGDAGDVSGAPEDLLFRDRPLLISVLLWVVLAVAVLYVGASAS